MTSGRIQLPAVAGFLVVVAAACILVARQPVTAPWWLYADADATYSGSALNILTGHHTVYLDHPGLVEEELLAATFGAVSIPHGGPSLGWSAGEMLHLDRARPVFRGWAILFFVGGAALTFLLLTRLLGHWTWGTAGGLLWLAQPDLADSIQIRPDVLLAALALVVGFFATRAVERKSPLALVFGAAMLGFTLMVKLHAAALLVPLLLAAVAGYPGETWPIRLRAELRAWLARHRLASGIAVGSWLVLAVALNWRAPGPNLAAHSALLLGLGLPVLIYLGISLLVRRSSHVPLLRRVFDPLFVILALALALGMLVPIGLVAGDGLRALSSLVTTLAGRNINQGVTPFSGHSASFWSFPLLEAAAVFALAGVATVLGLRRRDVWPAIWFAGAAAAAVMAAARSGEIRYYALPYVLSIPAALWLFRRRARASAPLLVWLVVGVVLAPTFWHADDNANSARAQEAQAAAATRLADRLLKPGEAALVPGLPVPDVRWYGLVESFTRWQPAYPYRFIEDSQYATGIAAAHNLRIRYFIGPGALAFPARGQVTLGAGSYTVRRVPGPRGQADGIGAVELLSGPGT